MAVAGLRGTGDWAAGERPKNFREYIMWRNPNGTAPLTALLSRMRSESTDDPEFNWWEEELNAIRVTTDATVYATTDVTLTLASGTFGGQDLVAGDMLLVEKAMPNNAYTHELLIVSSVTSATVIVVARGQSGSTAVPIAGSTALTKIGNSFEEGSTSPNAASRNPTKMYNFCQIFKTAYRITNSAKVTKTRTGDPLKNDKKRKMFDHSTAMELAFLFGRRYETTGASGKPQRTTGGLLWTLAQYSSTRITAFTTTVTETTLLAAIYPIWDYNTGAGSERICFAGNVALNTLNQLASAGSRTRVTFDGFVNLYGMRLQRWIFPQGEIYIKTHPLFNTHALFKNDMMVLDPSAIRYRYLTGRDTKAQDNIQANDADEQKGQWIGECGLEMEHAKTSCYLANLTYP